MSGPATIRAAQAMYGKFLANVHQVGKSDGMTNLFHSGMVLACTSGVGFAIFSLMGNGKKLEGR